MVDLLEAYSHNVEKIYTTLRLLAQKKDWLPNGKNRYTTKPEQ